MQDLINERNTSHLATFKPPRKLKKSPKSLALIDQNLCTGCEICTASCPVDCIELINIKDSTTLLTSQILEIDFTRCIGCKKCFDDCPWEAIEMTHPNDYQDEWLKKTITSDVFSLPIAKFQ